MVVKKTSDAIGSARAALDVNGDGKIDHKDFIEAARKAGSKVIPPKSAFDANNDGIIDHRDALIAAKIAGAAITGAGATLAAGAYGGALVISGTAASISTGIVSVAGAAAGAFTGVILGTATTTSFLAMKTASGALVIVAESAAAVSPGLVSAFSALGSTAGAMNSTLIANIAGLPVIEAIAVNSGVSKGALVMIYGIPVAREVAIAAGLVSIVIVGAYAYFLLNSGVEKDQVAELVGAP